MNPNKPLPVGLSDEENIDHLLYHRVPSFDKPCAGGQHFTLGYRNDALDVVYICPNIGCPLFEKTEAVQVKTNESIVVPEEEDEMEPECECIQVDVDLVDNRECPVHGPGRDQ